MIDYSVSDGVCVLRLNAPPVNTISTSLLDELRSAVRRANADGDVRGVVITGRPDHFSAGADVGIFRDIGRAEDAVRASRVFQEAFQEVEDSAKPVVATVAGRMMGSALELAMACHHRVCARGTRFTMPEVNLGINPGAGGTGRLPRLIGVEAALRMLLTAETMGAEAAMAAGLVDAICESGELVERARSLLDSSPAPRRTSESTEKVQDAAANNAAIREAAVALEKGQPEIIAPLKILDAVKTGLDESFRAGLLKEQEVFAECMATAATQNKIYLFFATRETSKVPDLAGAEPRKIAKTAVVGMGTMGTGIAHALIMGGVSVAVWDENASATEKGRDRIKRSVEKRVAQGQLAADRASRMLSLLSTASRWEELADAELVIEAVFEDVETKRAVLGRLDDLCAPDAIVATNTSTISLDVLAEGMSCPERLVGIHFFNPAHRMPLVEVIRRDGASDGAVATALAFVKGIRKRPVLVRDRVGFLVNRLFVPYVKEAFLLLEEGAAASDIDAAMVEFGFPMGPLTVIDLAGLDILAFTDRVMTDAFPAHGSLSPVARRLVDSGHLGQKTGAGVYRYGESEYTRHRSAETGRIIAEVQREAGRARREIGREEIIQRLVLRMVAEAFRVLEEGIALRESDIDAAMVMGIGFPDFRGGVLRHARGLGLANVLGQLEGLTARFGERFAPCELLRQQKGTH